MGSSSPISPEQPLRSITQVNFLMPLAHNKSLERVHLSHTPSYLGPNVTRSILVCFSHPTQAYCIHHSGPKASALGPRMGLRADPESASDNAFVSLYTPLLSHLKRWALPPQAQARICWLCTPVLGPKPLFWSFY